MDIKAGFHRSAVRSINKVATSPRTAAAAFAMVAFHDRWSDEVSDESRFLAFCSSMRHISHAQILQDLWVLFELDFKPSGYFVEFGAHDGTMHSNTKLLEERFGWTGLLAEPNPQMAGVLRGERSAKVDSRCVWDVTGQKVELLITGDPELSAVIGEAAPDLHSATRLETAVDLVKVETISLNDLLEQHEAPKDFDFLSVDTEGTELKILQGFNLDLYRPRLISVEHNHRSEERDLDALMFAHGYERRFRAMSDWDAWYKLRS